MVKPYLVGGLVHFLFFHILGITPTHFHIFQRGGYTTNQFGLHRNIVQAIGSHLSDETSRQVCCVTLSRRPWQQSRG